MRRPIDDDRNSQGDDEESPLLPKVSTPSSQQEGKVLKEAKAEEISASKLKWIMASMWIGTFCAGLDGTLIATLGSSIATEFHSLPLLAWLATMYLVATAATQTLAGKLTDIYSRRNGLLLCNFLFAIGNLICGIAQDRSMIILGRALAGLGGGGLNTISTIVAIDLIPPRRRGLWQGISNVCWSLGNGLGGVFGGFLNDVWDLETRVPSATSIDSGFRGYDMYTRRKAEDAGGTVSTQTGRFPRIFVADSHAGAFLDGS